MLVYVDFDMFSYSQTLIVFNGENEVTRTYAPIDNLPKRIIETCYTFDAFEVKFNDERFLPKIVKEVSVLEATQYNVNKIKFI